MEKLIKFIAEGITGQKAEVTMQEEDNGVTFLLKVPEESIGQIIGKQGKTIKAIKTLVGIKATQEEFTKFWNIEVVSA